MPINAVNFAPISDEGSDRKMVERIKAWLDESSNDKERIAGLNHETWRGLQAAYDGTDLLPRPWWLADVRSNKLKARVDRIVGLYVADQPRVSYEPQEIDDALMARYLDSLQDSDWYNGGLDRELRAVTLDACVFGTGFFKTYYDPVARRIRTRRVHPEKMFVDPDADLSLLGADFVAELASQPLDKVARLYPFAFKKDGIAVVQDKLYVLTDALPYVYTPPPPGTSYPAQESGRGVTRGGDRARVLLCQFWIRDIGMVDWLMSKEDRKRIGGDDVKAVVVTLAGNHVLKVEPSPYRTGWHPYTVFRSQIRTNSWWGRGDVEGQVSVQRARDVILSRSTHHIQLTVNPTWTVNANVMTNMPVSFEQIPGKIYESNGAPRDAIVANQPPQLPGEVLGFMAQLDLDNDDETGVNEAAQGRKPKGVESGKAIQALQQQLAQRLQPRLDDLRESLKNYGRRYVDLAIAEYSEKQVQRILGKTVAMDWDALKKDAAGEFDVRVQVGSGIELDPNTLLESGIQLYQMGVFGQPGSPEANLKLFQAIRRFWPNAEQEIREGEKAKRAQFDQAAVQQVEGPTGSPPGGPPPSPALPPQPMPAPPAPQPAPVPAMV